jgi:hypothetical protein
MTTRLPHRERLQATGAAIFDRSLPRRPDEVCFIMRGIRCWEIRRDGADFAARFHIGQNEWLSLGAGTEDGAYAAILAHHRRIEAVPGHYTPEGEATLRTAAHEVAAENWLQAAIPF